MFCITYLLHNTEKEFFFFCQSVIHIEHKHETVGSNRFSSLFFLFTQLSKIVYVYVSFSYSTNYFSQ